MRHPFPAGPDLSAYVPNAQVEQNIAYLSAKLSATPGWVGVCGPSGVGKTLLVRLLMRRLSDRFTPLYVPAAGFTPRELERWMESEAGGRRGESAAALATRLTVSGRPLLLAIDEAQHATHELVARLEALCAGPEKVRAVLVWSHNDGDALPPPLARCPTRVFVDALELARVPAYVEAQLARVGASEEIRGLLAGPTLNRIALASSGNQRAIQRMADEALVAIARSSHDGARREPGAVRSAYLVDAVHRARPPRRLLALGPRTKLALACFAATLVILTLLCAR